jgi:riboflavin synthase
VNALTSGVCQVAIIPHTWEHTNLRELRPGDPVNLEGDLIGKYVGRMVSAWERAGGTGGAV